MLALNNLRKKSPGIIVVGSYPPIVQSILDFDYLLGKKAPSVYAGVGGRKKFERYFWGKEEVLMPYYPGISELPPKFIKDNTFFLSVVSGRRVLSSTKDILKNLSPIEGGVIFAEDTPEAHSLALFEKAQKANKLIIGPASVGLLIPGFFKLGAIGGVLPAQIAHPTILTPGETAVFSASGGMVNEIINIFAQRNKGISVAASFGGERFPITRPIDALEIAEKDDSTKQIVYFGEIGGTDEYDMADAIARKKITKPLIAYIAGSVSEVFEEAPQFGHAKAIVKSRKESAKEKTETLRKSGVNVASSFQEFVSLIDKIPPMKKIQSYDVENLESRKNALFVSTISQETDEGVKILGEDLTNLAKKHSFPFIVSSLLLGKSHVSKDFESFTNTVFKLMVDHGPQVSGAVNTIVAARAGKDLVASLASGILTVGKRFGGAVNGAADNWLTGVKGNLKPHDFVEDFAKKGIYIEGIGHRKYSINNPDPRVAEILKLTKTLKKKKFLTFAKEVEKITTGKKGNLILNADGAIAAVALDILAEKEKLTQSELSDLVRIEFFNTLFVIPRSVGLVAHYLDQKRLDEGLFRLPGSEVSNIRQI